MMHQNEKLDQKELEFWENKFPLPNEHKQLVVQQFGQKGGFQTFIETGTYLGLMVHAQLKNFSRIYSIELDKKLFEQAKEKFSSNHHVTILHGDSGDVLYKLMKDINEPAMFWLDGHYSGGITAKGEKECPILNELDAILNAKPFEHLLLIDDARLFTGDNDYPTIEELRNIIKQKLPASSIQVKYDMIICQLVCHVEKSH